MAKKREEIKMEAQKSEKLTYEQLEQVAGNLNKQCQQLYSQLKGAQNTIAEFNEIGMLLDVLGKAEYFSDDFVTRCSKKIEEIISRAMDAAEKQEAEEQKN